MKPWPGRRSAGVRYPLALAVLLGSFLGVATARTNEDPGFASRPGDGRSCTVCDLPIEGAATQSQHEGRTIWLHPGECRAHWQHEPELYFRDLQARGVLFDEESVRGGTGYGWFLFGLYVLIGSVGGAFASYVAVSRGHPPIRWFFLGLAFNLLALAAVLSRPPADRSALPGGIPRGLRKVPTTRAPVACPGCGSPNHPAAGECLACRAAMRPMVTAETTRI